MRRVGIWAVWMLAIPAQGGLSGGCLAAARRPPSAGAVATADTAEKESLPGEPAPAVAGSVRSRSARARAVRRARYRSARAVRAGRRERVVAALAPRRAGTTPRQVAARPVASTGPRAGRLIVYRAGLILMVLDRKGAMEEAVRATLAAGGYLQRRTNRYLVLRVPVEHFHDLLGRIEKIGEVRNKSVTAEDVTRQFTDLTVRLRAAEAVLERLKALLARAKNVEESLAIEREMARLLEKIERIKGTLRYLQHHASLSTIRVDFRERPLHRRPVRSQWRNPFYWVRSLGLFSVMRF